ncbi:hypothetical protein [Shimia sp.]|uniref:hypothetical protein n=1 Tax=Shimia sp. TaxID=1954381 RepID=UPI003BA89450
MSNTNSADTYPRPDWLDRAATAFVITVMIIAWIGIAIYAGQIFAGEATSALLDLR